MSVENRRGRSRVVAYWHGRRPEPNGRQYRLVVKENAAMTRAGRFIHPTLELHERGHSGRWIELYSWDVFGHSVEWYDLPAWM